MSSTLVRTPFTASLPPANFSRHAFTDPPEFVVSFDRDEVQQRAAELAARGVFIGTSSWKYPGWLNQLYSPSRYEYRGRVAKTRFERDCLSEYAGVFKTACVDAAYYDFPRREYLERLAEQVPPDFRFAFKVTDAITIKRYPSLPRFGLRAGQRNEHFLDANLFAKAFLKPCEAIRDRVGVFLFEFSRFYPSDYQRGRDFVADLDAFLAELPPGWPYAIEIRNAPWLAAEYFACLARHRATHVFNSWEAMPSVSEQLALPESRTHPQLIAARFLLKPGRKYEGAVKTFQPYDRVRDVNAEARAAGVTLINEGIANPNRNTYIYVNNRLEGNALETIAAMVRMVRSSDDDSGQSSSVCTSPSPSP